MLGIAAAPYGWSSEPDRPAAEKTLETYVAEAAASGCDGVETIAEGVEPWLARYGVRVSGAYVSAPFHLPWDETGAAQRCLPAARELARLGGTFLLVNCDPKGSWGNRERKTAAELRQQGANLSHLAELVAPLGVRVAMHNHANTSPLHLDDLASVTDHADAAVGVCLDTGWAITSQDDPLARIRALGSRLTALHLRNQVGPQPVEWLGEGDLDLRETVRALHQVGYEGWLTTELYYPAGTVRTMSIVEDHRRSNDLLRRLWAEVRA